MGVVSAGFALESESEVEWRGEDEMIDIGFNFGAAQGLR